MCRNHSHAVVTGNTGAILQDGTVVHIAGLASEEFTLEIAPTGERLTVPACSTLLLLSHVRDTAFSSPSHLMAALTALLFALDENESVSGTLM